MILFFGPPGSGKSVQGEMLVRRNGWQWLSTGQLFRDSSDKEVIERMTSGELIDDDLTNKVLFEALEPLHNQERIVIDGYPRNTAQASWLDDYLATVKGEIDCLIVFEVPEQELIRRLAGRGRTEDTLQVIERRIAIYHERTQPVIEYYRQRNIPICLIDGVGDVNEVHERIQRAVETCSLV